MIKFVKKTLIFALGAGLLLVIIFYTNNFLINPYPELVSLKQAIKENADIIMFGSSVNKSFALEDTDKRSISGMLDDLLTDEKVVDISHGAYHSEIYYEFVKYILKQGAKPIIIIPINLRSFSPMWDLKPGYQFIKEKYLIEGLPDWINFRKHPIVTKYAFLNSPVYYGDSIIGKVSEFEYDKMNVTDTLLELKKGFIYSYMESLSPTHRKLIALENICDLCDKNKIVLVLYITPIDYFHAKKIGISDFEQKQLQNIEVIKKHLRNYDIVLLDLSKSLSTSFFDYTVRPHEHLNMHGRKKVAREIKKSLRNFLKNDTSENDN